jgi:hypothetical protein
MEHGRPLGVVQDRIMSIPTVVTGGRGDNAYMHICTPKG